MKIRLSIVLACVIAIALLPSCAGLQNTVVSDTTTTQPDGTVIKTTITASNSDAALAAGADLASAVASYAMPRVIADK